MLFLPEQCEAVLERLLVDAIGANRRGQTACDLCKGLRLIDVKRDDECRVANRQSQAERANGSVLHEHRT